MEKSDEFRKELYNKRIANLEKIAKERIAEEILNTEKRKPSQREVNKMYKERLKNYSKKIEKLNLGVAVGGPASMV